MEKFFVFLRDPGRLVLINSVLLSLLIFMFYFFEATSNLHMQKNFRRTYWMRSWSLFFKEEEKNILKIGCVSVL
jgi:hypothetical protein